MGHPMGLGIEFKRWQFLLASPFFLPKIDKSHFSPVNKLNKPKYIQFGIYFFNTFRNTFLHS